MGAVVHSMTRNQFTRCTALVLVTNAEGAAGSCATWGRRGRATVDSGWTTAVAAAPDSSIAPWVARNHHWCEGARAAWCQRSSGDGWTAAASATTLGRHRQHEPSVASVPLRLLQWLWKPLWVLVQVRVARVARIDNVACTRVQVDSSWA